MPNPQPGGPGIAIYSSGLLPKTLPAWLNPPGIKVLTVIASTYLWCNTKRGGFFYITLLYCFNFFGLEKQQRKVQRKQLILILCITRMTISILKVFACTLHFIKCCKNAFFSMKCFCFSNTSFQGRPLSS